MSDSNNPIFVIGLMLVSILVVSGCTTIYIEGEKFCHSIGYNHFERSGLLDSGDGECWNKTSAGEIKNRVRVWYHSDGSWSYEPK